MVLHTANLSVQYITAGRQFPKLLKYVSCNTPVDNNCVRSRVHEMR